MQPVIGLNGDIVGRDASGEGRPRIELGLHYAAAVERAGGVPVLLPPVRDEAAVAAQLAVVHGVVLVGGRDYDPALYGARPHPRTSLLDPIRAAYDLKLADAALRLRRPLLAICGGMQLVNIVRGGTLDQHLPEMPGVTLAHADRADTIAHDVTVAAGSRLAEIVGAGPLAVNSSHHQAVARPGRGLRVTARSTDGVIEAVEPDPEEGFLLGVQWHPERLTDRPPHLALFAALIRAARIT